MQSLKLYLLKYLEVTWSTRECYSAQNAYYGPYFVSQYNAQVCQASLQG